MFMIVPIFNSMSRIDRVADRGGLRRGRLGLADALERGGAAHAPGIVIGSIFVVTIVIGDYVTIGVMGGQQIASIGKVIQVQLSYLQFPLAAANAVVLLAVVLMIIWGMTRLVDIRAELRPRVARACVPARAGGAAGALPGTAESQRRAL